MRVCRDYSLYSPETSRPLVLALGNFDGVHLGHQALLGRVIEEARSRGGIPAVFTFSGHPQEILHPGSKPRLLTTPDQRLNLFHKLGIELCFVVPFTREFSQQSPEEFVETVLVKRLKVAAVCLGYNAFFGKGRAGDGKLMRKLAEQHGFAFEEMQPVAFPGEAGGEYVSSSLIRGFIEEGDLGKAAAALGRPFGIFARVVRGAGRGRELGFPTANLATDGLILPPPGVYPVEVREIETLQDFAKVGMLNYRGVTGGLFEKGVLNYGARPTFKDAGPAAEVHILDYAGDLYGRTVEVIFHDRLRPEMAFEGPEALQDQIRKDIEAARRSF